MAAAAAAAVAAAVVAREALLVARVASARARAHRCVIVIDDVTFKPGLGVPLVLESQKLVVAQQVIASDRLGDGL